ncbi:heme/hemin ABC transporter substrate-binding protein [Parafilimonas sp.]|uniref:heme/hemin ABC transporter substrate-binding protein n=1 Tax=Parafilimonas sp. TaxID=1969739 RepID=UPI0039E3F22D
MKKILLSALCFALAFASQAQQRIVSLNGAISEMLCALGLEKQIVGVDITSNFPEVLKSKPKLGHNRNISAEAVLALQPDIILTTQDQLNAQLKDQLQSAGIKTVVLQQEYSIEGTKKLLNDVAAAVGASAKAKELSQQYDNQVAALNIKPVNKKLLFIYARGAGSMMVSGTGTSLDKIIQLAGAKNAVNEFKDYKPYSSEALVAENPDVILLFTSGLQSVGGIEGMLKIPGIAQTTAGKKKQVISMDGEMLSGFGLRLPQAIRELNKQIAAFN